MQTWFEIVHSVRGFMSSLNDLRTKFCNTYVVDYQNLVKYLDQCLNKTRKVVLMIRLATCSSHWCSLLWPVCVVAHQVQQDQLALLLHWSQAVRPLETSRCLSQLWASVYVCTIIYLFYLLWSVSWDRKWWTALPLECIKASNSKSIL